jgi:hypothetical protein
LLEEIAKVEALLAVDNDYLLRKKRFLLMKRLRNCPREGEEGVSVGRVQKDYRSYLERQRQKELELRNERARI